MSFCVLRFLLLLVLILGTTPRGSEGSWCVADEQMPSEELEKAMKWACENGGDCSPIQQGQPCYDPNTILDHSSYAFNSYYQRMKHKGGDCYFNAAAIITDQDPSHDSCKFELTP